MNDSVEYVIRVVLRARDDLSLALAKVREEIRSLDTDVDNLDHSLGGLNSKITSLNQRAKATAETLGRLKKATDDLGGSVRNFNKLEEELAKAEDKSEKATQRQREAMGHKTVVVRDLGDATDKTTQSEKQNAIATQLAALSTEKATKATERKTVASKAAERAARKEVDKLLINAYRDEAKANTERAESLKGLEVAARDAKRELAELKQLQGVAPTITSRTTPEGFDPGMLEALKLAERKRDEAVAAREAARKESARVSKELVAERIRAAGGVPAAEDPHVIETEKALGIARREERKAKKALAEAQEEAAKVDLETAPQATLARLREQQQTLERGIRTAGARVTTAFKENKEAQEAANRQQRESLVQHVLLMQTYDQALNETREAEKKQTAAVKETTKAVAEKTVTEKKAADATDEVISKERFATRVFGDSSRRWQVYDTQLEKVVNRLGSLARAEEEAAKANAEHREQLEKISASTADEAGNRQRFEETTRRQTERLEKMSGAAKIVEEIEVQPEIDEAKAEAKVEEAIKKTVGKPKKVKAKVKVEVEEEIDLDFDPDDLMREALGFEHMEEEGFDVSPHIHIQSEASGHFAEQGGVGDLPFSGGFGAGGGAQGADDALRKSEAANKAEEALRNKQKNKLAELVAAYEDQRQVLARLFAEYTRGIRPAREFVLWLEEAEKTTKRMARQATGLGSTDPNATARLLRQAETMAELRKSIGEREERKGKAATIEEETDAISKATSAYEEHDGTIAEVEERAIELHDRFRQLKIDFDEGRVSADDARDSFEQMGRQMRQLATSKDVAVGSLTQHGLFALARDPEIAAAQIKERENYVKQVETGLQQRDIAERKAQEKRVENEVRANQKSAESYEKFWTDAENARELLERKIAATREARDKRAIDAATAYDRITKGVPPDLLNLDDRDLAILNRLKRELDQVANSFDHLSEEQIHFASLSRLTNHVIQEHTTALREQRREMTQAQTAEERAAARDRLAASARARFGDAAGIRAMGERKAVDITPEDRVNLQNLAKDLRSVANEHERGSDAQLHYASMATVVEDSIKRVNNTLNDNERNLRRQQSQLGGLAGIFDRMAKAVNGSGDSIAALDNRMQGMIILAVMAFAQQFISAMIGLAGAIGAVASSALFAAGAIGGALVAGIAQALPLVGLFAATMARVKGVMEAVQQTDLVQEQNFQRRNDQSKKLADTTNAVASAQDGLRSATDGLGAAHRRVTDAQQNLTKARADAVRQIRDLILAEKDAELAARGAALNQEDAQQRILDAVASGQGDLDRLGLDFEQATLDRQRAGNVLGDARTAGERARRGGVEGTEGVVQAKRQVQDAQRAVVDAERSVDRARRGIDQARRSADAAAADSFSGAEKLQFLLGQLTPAEREFYRAALALRRQYREVFRPVTDILIRELTKGADDLTALLRQPKIGNAFKGLADGVAEQMSRVRSELFDPTFVDQLLRILRQSRTNLKPVTDIVINLGHTFANIAESAGPALEKIIGWIEDLSERILGVTEDKTGLQDFFDKAADNAIAWADAVEAVIILFAHLAGIGADSGLGAVEDFTAKIREWTEWIDTHRDAVDEFFRNGIEVAKQLFRIVEALGAVAAEVNDPKKVKPLVDFITGTLVPALQDAIKFLGVITTGILWFLNLPGVGRVVEALIMIGLVNKVLRTSTTLLGVGIDNWKNLAKVVQGVFGVLNRLTFGGLNKALGGIATMVGDIVKKIPGLKKVGDRLKEIGDRLLGRTPAGGAPGAGVPVGGPARRVESEAEKAARAGRRAGTVARDVEVAGEVAAGGAGGGLLSRVGRLARSGRLLRGAAGVGAKAGIAGLAIDFGINLIDSNGDPIKAVRNTASDLTFGLIPRAKDEKGQESKRPKVTFAVDAGIDISGSDVEKRINTLRDDIDRRTKGISDRSKGQPVASQFDVARGLAQAPDRDALRKALTANAADKTAIKKDYNELGKAVGDTFFKGTEKSKGLEDQFKFLSTKVTGKEMLDTLKGTEAPARQAALDAMVAHTRELEKAGKLPQGATARIVKNISKELGLLPSNFRKSAKDSVEAISRELRRGDAVSAAEKLRQDLALTYQDFPKLAKTSGQNATSNFATELEFLRDKARHSTGRLKAQATEDFHAVQRAARKWGRQANTDLVDQLADMGVKGDKKARHARNLITTAFKTMATGVSGSSEDAAQALYEGLSNMGANAQEILEALGFKMPQIKLRKVQIQARGAVSGTVAAQKGAFIPGQGDGDRHPLLAESGEYVLNKRAVRSLGKETLDYLNFKLFPRFQEGGDVNWGGHPPLKGAIARAVGAIENRFPGLGIGSTTDHSRLTTSGNVSNHVLGLAADIGGATATMKEAANWIKQTMGPQLLEGIHQPGLSIKNGEVVPAGFWGSAWNQHINHIHIALRSLTGRLADAGPGALRLLSQITAEGPPGILRSATQGWGRKARTAWNRYIRRKHDEQGGGDDRSYPTSPGAITADDFRSVARSALDILGIKSQVGFWVKTLLRQAINESTLNPNARNDTAAGRAAGGPKGILQVVDGTFAANKYPGHDNVFNALDNTLAAIRYVIGRYGGGDADRAVQVLWGRGGGAYAKGGEIPGPVGKAVPILAHAKEWVLNPLQQHAIARWAGMPVRKLKAALGFSGSHERGFAGGGDTGDPFFKQTAATDLFTTKAEQDRIRRIRQGIFRLPAIPLRSWEEVVVEANRAMRALNNVGNGWKERIKEINREITTIRKDVSDADKAKIEKLKKGGVAAKEAEQIAKIQGDITAEEKKKIAALQKERKELRTKPATRRQQSAKRRLGVLEALTREGGVLDTMDDAREAAAQEAETTHLIGPPAGTVTRDRGAIKRTTAAIKKIRQEIARLRRHGVTEKEKAKIKDADKRIKDEQDDLKDEKEQLKEDLRSHAQRIFRVVRTAKGRVASVIRRAPSGGRTAAQEQADFAQQQARENVRRIETEQGVVGGALTDAEGRLRRLQRGGVSKKEAPEVAKLEQQIKNLRDRGTKLRQEQAEGIQSLFEAQVAAQEADVNAINEQAGRALGGIDRGKRIATALGRNAAAFDQAQIGVLNQQANDLEAQIGRARAMGNTELANQLEDQVAELRTSIVELAQQMVQDQIDQVNNQAQRKLSRLDLVDRMAAALGRVGLGGPGTTASGQTLTREGVFQQRQAVLGEQRAGLAGILAQQQALPADQQNLKAIEDLTDQIYELDVTMAENTKALFNARIEDVNTAAQKAISREDRALRKQELTEQLAGTGMDLGARRRIFEERAGVLQTQRTGLQQLLDEAIRGGDQEAIDDLTAQLEENENATLENSVAINDLTKAQTQDWSSSAWTMFRQAIFTGAGGLLPQYRIPTAQTGAFVRSSGLVNVHAGEVIGHPERLLSGVKGGDNNYDVCVNIETPMEVADPVDLGNRIGYRLANNPNTR